MNSILFIYEKTLKNKIKKALKKPITYAYLVFIILYAVMIIASFGTIAKQFHLTTASNYAVILCILVFYIIPSNLVSYTKRKGLLFRLSDVHFVFPAPISPKMILLLAAIKSFAGTFLLGLVMTLLGIFSFHVSVPNMLAFFFLYSIMENVLEGSIIVICYGNETLPEKFMKSLVYLMYALMIVFAVVALYLLVNRGFSFSVLNDYLALPVIQLIPLVGWNIALVRLLVIGPTTLNIVCTVLYIVVTILLCIYAKKMKCTGEYFEDAISFAEDYSVKRAKAKKGEMSVSLGKGKLKQAKVKYKGKYAKAIFYRQLLEYKKNRFFIFGFQTIVSLIAGIGIAVAAVVVGWGSEAGMAKVFIIPGIIAYILFIFSGYATKWSKELENPYTYLIPDHNFKKLWYATEMELIRAVIDGLIITLPGAIVMGIDPISTILTVLIYVCISANKLYFNMLADALVGKILGSTAQNILKVLLQGIVISISIVAAAIFGIIFNIQIGFAVMILVTALLTLAGMFAASTMFDRMEVE